MMNVLGSLGKSRVQPRALAVLLRDGQRNLHALAAVCGMSLSVTWKGIQQLQEAGLVTSTLTKQRGGRVCSLTPAGVDVAKVILAMKAANARAATSTELFAAVEERTLRQLRYEANVDLEDLAESFGLSAQEIAAIEEDPSPVIGDVSRFVAALGSVWKLFPLACVKPALVPVAAPGCLFDGDALARCVEALAVDLIEEGSRSDGVFLLRSAVRIGDLRHLAELTENDLANRLRMSRSAVTWAEHETRPGVRTVTRHLDAIRAPLVLLAAGPGRTARLAFPEQGPRASSRRRPSR
jgi:transcriptional regulator with XRE-family HTH domain/biotin operon repressor